jgi:hypothetical protein
MHKHLRALLTVGLGLFVMLAEVQAPVRAQGSPASGGPQAPAVTILAQPGQAYIHLSTLNNTNGDATFLENVALNGNPNARFLTISQSSPYNFTTGFYNHPLGVYYDTIANRWTIYNDDNVDMAQPLAWNVFIPPQDGTLILHTSSGANSVGSQTFIDNPQFNNQPDAVIFVQHVFNPGGVGGNNYTPTVAVAYDNVRQQWSIMNADGTPFPSGISFFVLKASPDETFFQHISSPANHLSEADSTTLDNPLINGNPDAQILVTQNYGTGATNFALDHRVALYYDQSIARWDIVCACTTMPNGVMFNVLVIPPKSGFFVQTATIENTTCCGTAINNPDLNNNPDALIYVTQNWNPPEAPNDIYNDHPVGVDYYFGGWFIYNLDGGTMPVGASFNVYYTLPRGNSFSVSASASNSSAASTTINNPLLDQNPSAIAISTYNDDPAGFPGGVYTYPVGLKYYAPLSAWQIFSDIGPTFEITQSYNLLVPPPASTFIHTATAPSVFANSTVIDNPLTNGDPSALVFVTPLDNGGLNQENVGVWYDGTNWEIFNENSLVPMTVNTAYNVFVIKRHYLFLPLVQR